MATLEIAFETAKMAQALRYLQDLCVCDERCAKAVAFMAEDEGFYNRLIHVARAPYGRAVSLVPSEYFDGVLATLTALWRTAPRGHADPPLSAAGQEGAQPVGDPE